jgi:hypothetical protein
MPVLRVELRASGTLAAAMLSFHAAGAAGVLLVAPGAVGIALAVLLIALGAAAAWDRALLRGPHSIRVLEVASDGAMRAFLAGGEKLQGRAAGRSHVGPWWVVLPFAGRRRVALVAADMLAPDEFRRLRLWALWGRVPARNAGARAG